MLQVLLYTLNPNYMYYTHVYDVISCQDHTLPEVEQWSGDKTLIHDVEYRRNDYYTLRMLSAREFMKGLSNNCRFTKTTTYEFVDVLMVHL